MPSKSKAQHNLMAMVANNSSKAKSLGIPKAVGKDYIKADKGKKFAKGGKVANLKKMFKGKETHSEELKEAKAIKSGKITPEQYASGEDMEKKAKTKKYAAGGAVKNFPQPKAMGGMNLKSGGSVKCMSKGGSASSRADGMAQRGKTKGKML